MSEKMPSEYLNIHFLRYQIDNATRAMREWLEGNAKIDKEKHFSEGYCQGLQYAGELASWLTSQDEMFKEWRDANEAKERKQ